MAFPSWHTHTARPYPPPVLSPSSVVYTGRRKEGEREGRAAGGIGGERGRERGGVGEVGVLWE